MIKNCANPKCNKSFTTKDSRQQSCSKTCADVRRSTNAWKPKTTVALQPEVPKVSIVRHTLGSLPPPEELPAPYAKRVHDMWAALVGDGPTRIA